LIKVCARVSRFDKYLLSQLLALFGFFSLVLVAVYWVNRAVGLFDQLIGDGQSALVFLQFSLLTLPNVIRLVLPVSAFVAAVYVGNRLISESELVVMQATGFSSFRLARPVFWFGVSVALMMLILMNWLVPASRTALEDRSAEISQDLSAQFLKDGVFLHPSTGLTLYIRDINARGELLDLFLADDRSLTEPTVYTARRALFLRASDGPKLLMFEGIMQTLNRKTKQLAVTRFSDFTYDLTGMIAPKTSRNRARAEMSTADLFYPSKAVLQETGDTVAALRFEGHSRLAQPLLALSAAMIGFASLLLGAFSRFGVWRQILIATVILLVVQTISTLATSVGDKVAYGWLLAYAAPLVGLAVAAAELWLTQRPRRIGKAEAAT
jgi:lipopolysaccharide export system permease protein